MNAYRVLQARGKHQVCFCQACAPCDVTRCSHKNGEQAFDGLVDLVSACHDAWPQLGCCGLGHDCLNVLERSPLQHADISSSGRHREERLAPLLHEEDESSSYRQQRLCRRRLLRTQNLLHLLLERSLRCVRLRLQDGINLRKSRRELLIQFLKIPRRRYRRLADAAQVSIHRPLPHRLVALSVLPVVKLKVGRLELLDTGSLGGGGEGDLAIDPIVLRADRAEREEVPRERLAEWVHLHLDFDRLLLLLLREWLQVEDDEARLEELDVHSFGPAGAEDSQPERHKDIAHERRDGIASTCTRIAITCVAAAAFALAARDAPQHAPLPLRSLWLHVTRHNMRRCHCVRSGCTRIATTCSAAAAFALAACESPS
eukprot:6356659-Prymnesium_polylepis.1